MAQNLTRISLFPRFEIYALKQILINNNNVRCNEAKCGKRSKITRKKYLGCALLCMRPMNNSIMEWWQYESSILSVFRPITLLSAYSITDTVFAFNSFRYAMEFMNHSHIQRLYRIGTDNVYVHERPKINNIFALLYINYYVCWWVNRFELILVFAFSEQLSNKPHWGADPENRNGLCRIADHLRFVTPGPVAHYQNVLWHILAANGKDRFC